MVTPPKVLMCFIAFCLQYQWVSRHSCCRPGYTSRPDFATLKRMRSHACVITKNKKASRVKWKGFSALLSHILAQMPARHLPCSHLGFPALLNSAGINFTPSFCFAKKHAFACLSEHHKTEKAPRSKWKGFFCFAFAHSRSNAC